MMEVIPIYKQYPTSVLVYHTNITKRKLSEEETANHYNFLESLIDTIPMPIFYKDFNGIYQGCNKAFADFVVGLPKEKIIGSSLYDLSESIPKDLADIYKSQDVDLINRQGEQFYECQVKCFDGVRRNFIFNKAIYRDSQNNPAGIIGVMQDISDRQENERLREKEVHHRVKNNLQVISSLLNLQASNFTDPEVTEAFREIQNRVESISIAHQDLYRSKDLEYLRFDEYVKHLIENLIHAYTGKNNISLRLEVNNFYFGIDTIIPLGMILNELVSNSLKYAFTNENSSENEIYITMHQNEDGCYTLIIGDNGKGIPQKIDVNESDSLGLQIVNKLVEQINGTIELKRNKGAEFIIRFDDAKKINL